MNKIIVLLTGILLSLSANAISESGSLSSDQKTVLDAVITGLGVEHVSTEKKDEIYNLFKHALTRDWYASWHSNNSLTANKSKDSKTQMFDLTVVDENRIYIISLIHFSSVKQIHVTQRELIDMSSSNVMTNYKKHKENEKFEIVSETDSYAFFKKKGFAQNVVSHMKTPNGLTAYIDYKVLDL